MSNTVGNNTQICPFTWIHTKRKFGLFSVEIHPPFRFSGNPFSNFYVANSVEKPTNQQTDIDDNITSHTGFMQSYINTETCCPICFTNEELFDFFKYSSSTFISTGMFKILVSIFFCLPQILYHSPLFSNILHITQGHVLSMT